MPSPPPHRPQGQDAAPVPTRSAWILSLASLALVTGASFGLVRSIEASDAPVISAHDASARPRSQCSIAGSGSNLALTERLLAGFVSDTPIELASESIGTAGGLRALRDGAIDAALISRRLGSEEAEGLRVVVYAATEVVLVTRAPPDAKEPPGAMATPVAPDAVAAIFRGEQANATPLLRELGDSGVATLRSQWPSLAEAHDAAVRDGRFEVLFSDDAMALALESVHEATGLFDRGQIALRRLPLRAHPIREGDAIPPWKELAIVVRATPPTWGCPNESLERLIAWLTSPFARDRVESLGYLAPEAR